MAEVGFLDNGEDVRKGRRRVDYGTLGRIAEDLVVKRAPGVVALVLGIDQNLQEGNKVNFGIGGLISHAIKDMLTCISFDMIPVPYLQPFSIAKSISRTGRGRLGSPLDNVHCLTGSSVNSMAAITFRGDDAPDRCDAEFVVRDRSQERVEEEISLRGIIGRCRAGARGVASMSRPRVSVSYWKLSASAAESAWAVLRFLGEGEPSWLLMFEGDRGGEMGCCCCWRSGPGRLLRFAIVFAVRIAVGDVNSDCEEGSPEIQCTISSADTMVAHRNKDESSFAGYDTKRDRVCEFG